VSEEELDEVVGLLDDEYARDILAATSIEPMSAETLAERCDASLPTIYRRVKRLREADLLAAETQVDPDGHHYDRYSARLETVTVRLVDGRYEIEVDRVERDAADRFTELVEGLQR
jgi:DNA-binding Lrp family transcriptional regulator